MNSNLRWLILCFLLLNACRGDHEAFSPGFEVYALLPSEGLGDRSFVDVVYEGIERAKYVDDFSIRYVIPDNQEAGEAWIARIPELRSGVAPEILVIVAGNQWVAAVDRLNGRRGQCRILLLAGQAAVREGLASVTFRHFAPSYLAGYLSAGMVPGCRATVVEAFDAPFLQEFRHGFEQGVADAGGTVNNPVYLAAGFEGFTMPDSAYNLTHTLLPGNDLIFALGDGSNFGIINAARDWPEPRYVVGVDSDQSWMGLNVVTGSVIILYGTEIGEYISEFSAGRFASGQFTRSMEDGKTAFLLNSLIMGGITIPDTLVTRAIEKEKAYRMPVD